MARPGKLFDSDGEDAGAVLVLFDLFRNSDNHGVDRILGTDRARALFPASTPNRTVKIVDLHVLANI